MLNLLMAIPFIITPLVTRTIGYIVTAAGFARKAVVMVPWTTPPIINAWLSTGGSLGAVMTQIVCIIVSVIIIRHWRRSAFGFFTPASLSA